VHIGITPEKIEEIGYNETKKFNIEITAPSYMSTQRTNVLLTIEALGKRGTTNKTIEETVNILLVIHETTANDTLMYLDNAETAVNGIIASGFPSSLVSELLEDAKNAFNDDDYDQAKALALEIIQTKEAAEASYAIIGEISTKLKEAEYNGIDIPETKKLYDLAVAAFSREDYIRAEDRAKNAITAYAIESGGVNIVNFIVNNWLLISIAAMSLIIILFVSYRRMIVVVIKRKLDILKKESVIIKNLIMDIQKKHFEDGTVNAMSYHKSIYEYERRLAEIQKNKTKLISSMLNMKKPLDIITKFQNEIRDVNNTLQNTQKKYFVDRSISKSSYENNMNALNNEKIEIQKSIEIARAKAAEKPKLRTLMEFNRGSKNILPILIILMLVVPVYAIGDIQSAQNAIETAEDAIKDMQSLGFGITYANDTLEEAKLLLAQENYLGAQKTAEYVKTIKETAIRLDNLIDDTEIRLYDAENMGIDVTPARELFNAGITALNIEDYIAAEDYINQAYNKIDELESEFVLMLAAERKEFNLSEFITENWVFITLSFLLAAFIGFIGNRKIRTMKLRKVLKNLKIEKNTIEKLLRLTQKRYFEFKEIGNSEYNIAIDKYNKRLIQIKKEIPLLNSRLSK